MMAGLLQLTGTVLCAASCHCLQEISLQGLHAALQHPFISSDVKTVCSLLQTCKNWRAAMQQSAAGNMRVCVPRSYAAEQHIRSMQKLALFCSWLKQHAGLVGSIVFEGADVWCFHSDSSDEVVAAGHAYCDAAEQLLALGVQEAAAVGAAPPPAAAALMRTALQLHSCSISCVRSPALLLALPASLTHLDLTYSSRVWRSGLCLNSSSITAAVPQLSQLRSLQLSGEVGNACLAAIGQLAHLTRLNIWKVHVRAGGEAAGRCDVHLLPQQLQSLTVTVSSEGGPATVALGHVTALKALDLTLNCSAAPGSSLPFSLTALEEEDATASSAQYLGLTALQQLQRLDAGRGLEQPQLLRQLSTLAALTDIVLCYDDVMSAQRAAPGWQQLSSLRTLYIDIDDDSAQLDYAQGAVLLQGLAAATSLTHLFIRGPVVHEDLQLCAHLTALSRLQMLDLDHAGVASRSYALQLAALTGLAQLDVSGALGVDDVSVSVLALRLTRLQDLRFADCGLRSAAALPSIATLTGLTHLSLGGSVDTETGTLNQLRLGQADLLLLTPLTQLKWLYGFGLFSSGAVSGLWSDQKGWLQRPPAWLCQAHAPQQQE
jgi:hypothetical protein